MNHPPSEKIYLSPPHLSGREMEYVKEALESNYIAPLGPQLDAFEEKFAEITGFRHCLAVASGTAALHLALRCLGVERGDSVIASSLTFIGSVSSIVHLGATPTFIDSDLESWNLDPSLLKTEIERLSQKGTLPKAVIPTDLFGQPCDLDEIKRVCHPYDIPVISDSAESLGAMYKGTHTGIGAKAAAFSFNGNKIITTSGGGLLASDDKNLIERARYFSTQTREPVLHFEHKEIGYNYRMSNILAAIGIGQLEVLENRVIRKREIFKNYQHHLSDLPGIDFMPEPDYSYSNRWLTTLTVDADEFGCDRDALIRKLEEHNIESRPIWKPMHSQEPFSECRMVGSKVSDTLFKNGLCLPSGTQLETAQIDHIASLIKLLRP